MSRRSARGAPLEGLFSVAGGGACQSGQHASPAVVQGRDGGWKYCPVPFSIHESISVRHVMNER